MNWNWLPNGLTILRILAAPVVGHYIWAALDLDGASETNLYWLIAASIFTLAALTDWLDGWLARRLGATSAIGAQLDLWADKLLVAVFFAALLPTYPLAGLAGLLCFTVRDLAIMALRASQSAANLSASKLAKAKTALLMTGLVGLLWACALRLDAPAAFYQVIFWSVIGAIFVAAILSLYTGMQYVRAAFRQQKTAAPD